MCTYTLCQNDQLGKKQQQLNMLAKALVASLLALTVIHGQNLKSCSHWSEIGGCDSNPTICEDVRESYRCQLSAMADSDSYGCKPPSNGDVRDLMHLMEPVIQSVGPDSCAFSFEVLIGPKVPENCPNVTSALHVCEHTYNEARRHGEHTQLTEEEDCQIEKDAALCQGIALASKCSHNTRLVSLMDLHRTAMAARLSQCNIQGSVHDTFHETLGNVDEEEEEEGDLRSAVKSDLRPQATTSSSPRVAANVAVIVVLPTMVTTMMMMMMMMPH